MNSVFSSIPEYEGGILSPYVFNVGCGVENDLNGPTEKDCYARITTNTDADEFHRYVQKMTDNKYKIIFKNNVDGNLSVQLLGKHLIYAYYIKSRNEVRIIVDNCSVPLDTFCFGWDNSSSDFEVYQYALHYDPNNGHSPTTTNCGMLFIVRFADNSLFMYDGGDLLQCSDKALEGMMEFLHRITNTENGEKIRIAAWHISHAHNDHFCVCSKMLNRCHDELTVERFMFNFPSSSARRPDSQTEIFKSMLAKYCPDALFIKLHTGMSIRLANAQFDVLYTHEDAIRAELENPYPLRDYNCTSTVLKMTVAGRSVMWLGDTNTETEAIVENFYSEETWKSDIVQVAHHCFNYLSKLYPMIKAPYAMLPNSYFGGHTPENLPKLAEVLCHLESPDKITYSDVTSGITFKDGKYIKFLEEPCTGGEYDFSGY